MTRKVKLEPGNTLMGKFQKERTDAISEMFDNVDEYGIYPTSKFFVRLDNFVRKLLGEQATGLEMPKREGNHEGWVLQVSG